MKRRPRALKSLSLSENIGLEKNGEWHGMNGFEIESFFEPKVSLSLNHWWFCPFTLLTSLANRWQPFFVPKAARLHFSKAWAKLHLQEGPAWGCIIYKSRTLAPGGIRTHDFSIDIQYRSPGYTNFKTQIKLAPKPQSNSRAVRMSLQPRTLKSRARRFSCCSLIQKQ